MDIPLRQNWSATLYNNPPQDWSATVYYCTVRSPAPAMCRYTCWWRKMMMRHGMAYCTGIWHLVFSHTALASSSTWPWCPWHHRGLGAGGDK